MALSLNAVNNDRLECPQTLLENLWNTVHFLLDVSVFQHSIFNLFSGLNHLHLRVKAILRHGAKIFHHLIYSQPSYAVFDSWLESTLADHSLVKTLCRERQHLLTFYYDWAFIHNDVLFESLVHCLDALACRDFEFLPDIPSVVIEAAKLSPQHIFMVPFKGTRSKEIEDMDEQRVLDGQEEDEILTLDTQVLCERSHSKDALVRTTGSISPTEDGNEFAQNSRVLHTEIEKKESDEESLSVPQFSYNYVSPVTSPPEFSYLNEPDFVPSLPREPVPLPFKSSAKIQSDDSFVKIRKRSIPNIPKSFLESGGYVEPPALGSFPLPQKGQSVTSFLSSLSDTMPELDRENAHFNVSEALISAFERLRVQRKWEEMEKEGKEIGFDEMFGTVKKDVASCVPGPSKRFYSGRSFPRPPILHTETEESESEYWRQQPRRPPTTLKKKPKSRKLGSDGRSESLLSTTEASSSLTLSSEEEFTSCSFSAENVGLSLLRNAKMQEGQLPPASELQWLVSEVEAPQTLLPLPKNWTSASESESDYSSNSNVTSVGNIDKSMRLRGTTDWAPPRPQIIFTIHPSPSLYAFMEIQKYRCAGCGMKVDVRYASTFRYCNYLGRYFCTGCHTMKKARLPQMILHRWDFSPYLVSNFSATLLDSLHSDPVYNVLAINPQLNRKVKLSNFRNYRIQLCFLVGYLKNCKMAISLYEEFQKFPTYYTADVDLYSLEDLIHLRFSMGLPLHTKDFVARAIHHVLGCSLCRQLGFVCEICKRDDVLFPFQINRVSRCPECSSCFHLKCFHPGKSNCPKCVRVISRRTSMNVSTAAIAT